LVTPLYPSSKHFYSQVSQGISLGLFAGEVWKESAADPWLSQVNKSVI
jgi:hypothetical protein